jgi:hypothetical protein
LPSTPRQATQRRCGAFGSKPTSEKTLVFLTNNFGLPALTIPNFIAALADEAVLQVDQTPSANLVLYHLGERGQDRAVDRRQRRRARLRSCASGFAQSLNLFEKVNPTLLTISMKRIRATDIDLCLLRGFTTFVDRAAFLAAEDAFPFSQTRLCEQMTMLETRLGLALYQHQHNRLKLLPDGERVYKAAKELISVVDVFEVDIREIAGEAVAKRCRCELQESRSRQIFALDPRSHRSGTKSR